uniref:Uncharacterized protein n=1 Tax=Clandestinovirus TaxID=2831644 RepID=A0A8F8KMH7_9VIRU|nr:hypothetical protein KOM_12_599 [Clandestinovirus]
MDDTKKMKYLVGYLRRHAENIIVTEEQRMAMEHNETIDPDFRPWHCDSDDDSQSDSESNTNERTGWEVSEDILLGESVMDEIRAELNH